MNNTHTKGAKEKDKTAYSEASRARWAKVPKSERTKKMSELAKKKWKNSTPEQRKAQAIKMVKGQKKV